MPRLIQLTARIALFAGATWWLGWWAVPAVAFGLGFLGAANAGQAVLSATLAWALWLARSAAYAAFPVLLTRVGGIYRVPGVVLVVVTLAFGALLALSAAVVGETMRNRT